MNSNHKLTPLKLGLIGGCLSSTIGATHFIASQLDNKFKVPRNIEIICPRNIKDFEDFIFDKEIIAINNIGRFLSDLKIHFLLKKYQIKQVQIFNVGFFNTGLTFTNTFWKNLIFKIN